MAIHVCIVRVCATDKSWRLTSPAVVHESRAHRASSFVGSLPVSAIAKRFYRTHDPHAPQAPQCAEHYFPRNFNLNFAPPREARPCDDREITH